MVVGLFLVVVAALNPTRLGRCELLETRSVDRVTLLVLPAMRHHLVGVGAHEVALEAMEMRRLVLLLPCGKKKLDYTHIKKSVL